MSIALTAGTYRARATGEVVLGFSTNKGTPFIELYFEIQSGDCKGMKARWTSYFTDTAGKSGKTVSGRTIEAMQTAGWDGEDIAEFSDGGLHGLDTNDVDVVIEIEEYEDKQGEKRTTPKVQWVNKAGGYLNKAAAMSSGDAIAFGDKLRGLVVNTRAKGAKPDDSFEFGANAPAAAAPAANGRKAF